MRSGSAQARESWDGLEAGWSIMGHWAVTVDLQERGHAFVDHSNLVPDMEIVTKFYAKESQISGSTKGLTFLNELRKCEFPIKELVKILVVHFLKNTQSRSKIEISYPSLRT